MQPPGSKPMIGYCCTDGTSNYSDKKARVGITKLLISWLSEDSLLSSNWGELRVYFDTNTWDRDKNGLIYSDDGWLIQFRDLLMTLGFSDDAVGSVNYSEHGMQGKDFVSLDVEKPFLRENDPLTRFTNGIEIPPIGVHYMSVRDDLPF